MATIGRTVQPAGRAEGKDGRARWNGVPFLYLSPSLIVLTVFHFLPIFFALYISLFNWRVGQGAFLGLGNYMRAFGQEDFWGSLVVTIFYVVGTVPVALFLSFFIAYLLFQRIAGRGMYRILYFLPYVTSLVAVALVFRWIYHPEYGLLNWLLSFFGIPPLRWLQEPTGVFAMIGAALGFAVPPEFGGPSLALVSIIIFTIWHALGFDIIIMLAGLSNIPPELYDAARIDGARGWRLLRHVTLPMLSPTLFFLSIVSVIRAFQAFTPIYVMTNDNPLALNTAQTITVYIFHNFYSNTRLGYGSAVAILLSLVILGLTLIQFRLVGRRVHY